MLRYLSCIGVSVASITALLFLTFGITIFEFTNSFPYVNSDFIESFFDTSNLKSTIMLIAIVVESSILVFFGLQKVTKMYNLLCIATIILAFTPLLAENSLISDYLRENINTQVSIATIVVGLAIVLSMLLKFVAITPIVSAEKINANGYERIN